jgi:hypothetical protein
VEYCISEDGLKNPLKGISMKLLVFALYAQCRADAGRMVFGRSVMAYGTLDPETFEAFYLWLFGKYTHCAVSRGYGLKIKPILRCVYLINL